MNVSVVNLLAASGVTVSSTRESTDFPASHSLAPQRPYLPFRTGGATATSTGAIRLVYDLLSAQTWNTAALIRSNFASVKIQANALNNSTGWSAPTYDSSTLTLRRNPWTGRYSLIHRAATSPSFRFLSVLIESQAKVQEKETDTGPAPYFLLGGVWVGSSTSYPSDFLAEPTFRVIEPQTDLSPEHEGWTQRLTRGPVRVEIAADRLAVYSVASPAASSDDLAKFLELDRKARERDLLLLDPNLGDSAQVFVTRRTGNEWRLGGVAQGPVTFDEVLGP